MYYGFLLVPVEPVGTRVCSHFISPLTRTMIRYDTTPYRIIVCICILLCHRYRT